MDNSDIEHLEEIHDRLVKLYGETKSLSHLRRFRDIIKRLEIQVVSDSLRVQSLLDKHINKEKKERHETT